MPLIHAIGRVAFEIGAFTGKTAIRVLGPLLVVGKVTLLSLILYTYFNEAFEKLISFYGPVVLCCLTALGLFIAFSVFFNYIMCVIRGPGYAPLSGDFAICSKCSRTKPPRAHHCSVCNSCVLKMDHHCPWVNNCVGHKNHRYFLLFLLYVALGTAYYSLLVLPAVFKPSTGMLMFTFVLCVSLAIVLTAFAGWHWYLAVKGLTTIEFFMQYEVPTRRDRGRRYDFSRRNWRLNLELIFGSTDLPTILLPSTKALPYDGLHWPECRISV